MANDSLFTKIFGITILIYFLTSFPVGLSYIPSNLDYQSFKPDFISSQIYNNKITPDKTLLEYTLPQSIVNIELNNNNNVDIHAGDYYYFNYNYNNNESSNSNTKVNDNYRISNSNSNSNNTFNTDSDSRNITSADSNTLENHADSYYYQISSMDNYYKYSIFSDIVNTTTLWISEYGYVGVFSAALLENIFPPLPSELIFPLAGFTANSQSMGFVNGVMGMATSGAAGSTVGALVIYFISRKIGRTAVLKLGKYIGIEERDIKKTENWFEKHGQFAVFFGRMAPGVRELISIPAGIQKMKLSVFIIFTFAGSMVWSTALTLIGFYVGEAWNIFYDEYSFVFDIIAVIVIVAIILVLIFRHRNSKKRYKNDSRD